MTEQGIYRDIAERTGGDIYIGVVGPVRTGKSTFIRRFMDECVLPYIEDEYDRSRTVDSMPQAASGRTVMTAEPKFIPDESVRIRMGDTAMNVKMIDCVGYLIPEALGQNENGTPRMVNTPWSEEPMPFAEAAEIGTQKVICEHATIGMVVTTDGTIGEIPRESYLEAEERVVSELKALGKPFAIILNSARPNSDEARELALTLEKKYETPVALVNCLELNETDIRHILKLLLDEFPVTELVFRVPGWLSVTDRQHPLRESVFSEIAAISDGIAKMGDIAHVLADANRKEAGRTYEITELSAGDGTGEITLTLPAELFYSVIGDMTGLTVEDDASLLSLMRELAMCKTNWEKVAAALTDVGECGYGIVMPAKDEMRLEEPRLTKQPGGWGVKLRASARSSHMIRANIETEINPVIGTEEQAKDLLDYIAEQEGPDKDGIWDTNIFGKTVRQLVEEGMSGKVSKLTQESQLKLQETIQKVINDSNGGLVCIII